MARSARASSTLPDRTRPPTAQRGGQGLYRVATCSRGTTTCASGRRACSQDFMLLVARLGRVGVLTIQGAKRVGSRPRCQRAAYAIRRTRSALPHTERVPCCRHVSHNTNRRRKMPGATVAIRVRPSPRNGHAPPELTTQSWTCTLEGVTSPLTSAEAFWRGSPARASPQLSARPHHTGPRRHRGATAKSRAPAQGHTCTQ